MTNSPKRGAGPEDARTSELHTKRLVLREFRDDDRDAFAALNADPRVTDFLGAPLSRAESDTMVERIRQHLDAHGFSWWAVEVPGVSSFVGAVGLAVPTFSAHFTPCVEIAWRLAFPAWGHGYATEGARAVVAYAFESLDLAEIVSFTAESNTRSRHVMEAIGMTRDVGGDFDHPKVAEGGPLRRHVLYRLPRPV